jgi:hypothetical protein
MVAARLGNQANRNDFMNRFWYGDKEAHDAEAGEPSASGFLNLLKAFEKQPVDWSQAVRQFKKALAQEQRLRDQRLQIYRTYLNLFNLLQELPTLEIQLKDLMAEHKSTIHQLHEVQTNERKLPGEVDEAKNRRLEHRRFRPGILEILFSFGKAFREWRGKDKILESLMEQAEHNLAEARSQAAARQQAVASLDQKIQQITAEMEQQQRLLATAQEDLNKAKERFGAYFPLPATWDQEAKARELSSPWADPEWNEARAKVFLEALQLHKAFITANADTMRKSLQGACAAADGPGQPAGDVSQRAGRFSVGRVAPAGPSPVRSTHVRHLQ